MPARLIFHFTGRPDPVAVDTEQEVPVWRDEFADRADGHATIQATDGHVVHVNLAHVAYVEMVEREA